MELRTLRYFVAIAERGSVSAAAEVVAVTQPALSRQVRQLERELRLELFEHGPGRLTLTAAGRQFLAVARDVLRHADDAVAAAELLAAGRLTRVTIAAPATTFTDVIAPFLATFSSGDPLPTVIEAEGTSALTQGADLAIVTRRPEAAWRHRNLAVLPVWAYVPAEHRWSGSRSIPLAELVAEPLIMLDPCRRPRQLFLEALATAGLPMPEFIECGNAQVAQALAAAGRGVAVVSDDARFGLHGLHIDTGQAPLRISLHAAWSPRHHATDALAALAERLRTFCGELYGAEVIPAD
ncbi:MAG TPA: LysR family transcriptional regulator [Pseudonocardiaceae bacterium]|nr:LysR family transcriptional regulator [Pseudonocardiaceae bacterium]